MNYPVRVLLLSALAFLIIHGGFNSLLSNAQDVNNNNAFRLPQSIKPTTYEVTIHPHLENKTYQATVAIFADCITPTNVIILNGIDFTMENILVKKILSNSEELLVNATSDETSKWEEIKSQQQIKIPLSVTLESENKIVMMFKFTKALNEGRNGFFYREYFDRDDALWKLAATQFEPFGARATFPCFDEPAMKAIFKFKIIRNKQYKSLFNTQKLQTSQVNEELERDEYEDTPVMSTYILMFTVFPNDYEYKEETYGNLIVRAYAPKFYVNYVTLCLNSTQRALSFMENKTGIAFPARKLDVFGIQDFKGGMENWGLIAIVLSKMLYTSRGSELHKVSVTSLVTHEVVHHWFGNYVTMKWWNDLWVKEGITTYFDKVLLENETRMIKRFDEMKSAMQNDIQFSSHALSLPDNFTNALALYNGFVYYKGESIILMMENVLGRSRFYEGLRNFLNRYQYSSADSYDFWNAMTDVNTNNPNMNLTQLMEPWMKETNFPLIHVTFNSNGRSFTARQERFLLNKREIDQWQPKWPSKFQHLWNVPLTFKMSPTDATDQIVWLTTREQTFQLNESVSWIKLNYNHYGYYVTNYDSATWTHILANMRNRNFTPFDIAGILLDIKLLLKSGQFDIATLLDTLSILQTNPEPFTWLVGAEIIDDIFGHLRNHSQELEMFKRHIREIVSQAMTQTGYLWNQTNPSHNTKYMLIVTFATAMLVDESATKAYLLEEFDKLLQDENYRLNYDVEAHILPYGIANSPNDNSSWQIIWDRYQTTFDPELLTALSSSRNCTILKRLLMKLYQDLHATMEVLTAMAKIGRFPKSIWNYFSFIAKHLENTVAHSDINKLLEALAKTFDTEYDLQQMKTFFEQVPLGQSMSEYKNDLLEIILTNIKWKTVHLDNLKNYYQRKYP